MTFWTPENIRAASGGRWLVRPAKMPLPEGRPSDLPIPEELVAGVSTDTRTLKTGQAFVALRGERFDGHVFLREAAEAGAAVLIVDEEGAVPPGLRCGVVLVADTGKALLRLAAAYRATLKRTKVIGVCGSNGKTTTVRLVDHVLSACGLRGTASAKSFNNAVGVPLTVLSARESDAYLVCEMGTNHPGEVARLAEVVRPDVAVITSIGREHLEGLGDLAGVTAEEASVLKFIAPAGCAVVTADAPGLAPYLKGMGTLVTFGRSEGATLRLTDVRHEITDGRAGVVFTMNRRQTCKLALIGAHNALNAMAALAVARRLGIDEERAAAALECAGGAAMRLEVRTIGGVNVLNDAYNANPDSMIAAVQTAAALRQAGMGERLVCVLGEMLELGEANMEGHRAVAAALDEHRIDAAMLLGSGMRAAERALAERGWGPRVRFLESAAEDNATVIAGFVRPGDLVLVKGSRGVKLERVVEAMEKRASGGGMVEVRRGQLAAGTSSTH